MLELERDAVDVICCEELYMSGFSPNIYRAHLQQFVPDLVACLVCF